MAEKQHSKHSFNNISQAEISQRNGAGDIYFKGVSMYLKETLKSALKTKICINELQPNFPLREIVEYADAWDKQYVLQLLDEIQSELEEQVHLSYQHSLVERDKILHSYWCFYCTQARSYYRAIIRNPGHKTRLSFLL